MRVLELNHQANNHYLSIKTQKMKIKIWPLSMRWRMRKMMMMKMMRLSRRSTSRKDKERTKMTLKRRMSLTQMSLWRKR